MIVAAQCPTIRISKSNVPFALIAVSRSPLEKVVCIMYFIHLFYPVAESMQTPLSVRHKLVVLEQWLLSEIMLLGQDYAAGSYPCIDQWDSQASIMCVNSRTPRLGLDVPTCCKLVT